MNTIVKYALGALVLLCIVMAVGMAYQHSKISSQANTIATQASQIEGFKKDKEAQEVADSQLQADKDKIAKERNKYKAQLDEALKNQACADAPLPDDAKRVLKELYGGEGS